MNAKPFCCARARLTGDTVRDLIDALRLLDPDLKTTVQDVYVHNDYTHGRCGDRRLLKFYQRGS
jgi:hypothetical protein